MTKNPLDQITRYVLLGAVLLVAISISYYFVVFIPQKNKTQVELQKQEQKQKDKELSDKELQQTSNKRMLNACLADAETNYATSWDNLCEGLGKSKDCLLSNDQATRNDKIKNDAEDQCFKQYPQN